MDGASVATQDKGPKDKMTEVDPLTRRNFSDIQTDLERVLVKLKDTHAGPEQKRELLRQMRGLLQEATITANSL
jgi:hypothetical protein